MSELDTQTTQVEVPEQYRKSASPKAMTKTIITTLTTMTTMTTRTP